MSYIADAYLKAIAKIATPLEEKIEHLEAELAEANAAIARVAKVAELYEHQQREAFLRDKPGHALFGYCAASIRIALESSTPKPTDNSDFAVTPKGN